MSPFVLRLLVVWVAAGIACSASAQTPSWWRHYGNAGHNEGFDLAQDSAGFLYGIGTASAETLNVDGIATEVRGGRDALLVKWDSDGQVKWARTAGGDYQPPTDADQGGVVRFDHISNRLVVSGRYGSNIAYFDKHVLTGGSSNDEVDLYVATYDTAGHCLWAKGALGYRVLSQELLIDEASTIHVFGNAKVGGASFQENPIVAIPTGGFLAKYAMNGTLLSAERILTNGQLGDAQWIDEDWVIGGMARPGAQLFGTAIPVSTVGTSFVALTDTAGNVDWVKTFRSNYATEVWNVQVSSTGKILCSGFFVEDLILDGDTLYGPADMYTAFFAIMNAAGAVEQAVTIGSPTEIYVTDLKPGDNGESYLFGQFSDALELGDTLLASTSSRDAFVARFNGAAQPLAAMHWGRSPSFAGSILPTAQGLFVSCIYDSSMTVGSITAPAATVGNWNIFLARFDSLSGFTGVGELRSLAYDGLHIYANPNNGLCTIDLPEGLRTVGDLLLSIFDQNGRLIQRAPLSFTSTGVQLDIRAQAKGIYRVELSGGTRRYTGSIIFE